MICESHSEELALVAVLMKLFILCRFARTFVEGAVRAQKQVLPDPICRHWQIAVVVALRSLFWFACAVSILDVVGHRAQHGR
jgi:hypothetical protein